MCTWHNNCYNESIKVLNPHRNCIKFQHYFQLLKHFVVTDTHAMFTTVIHSLTAFTYSIAALHCSNETMNTNEREINSKRLTRGKSMWLRRPSVYACTKQACKMATNRKTESVHLESFLYFIIESIVNSLNVEIIAHECLQSCVKVVSNQVFTKITW